MRSNHLGELRSDMLRIILLFIIATAALAALINILAMRNIVAAILPIILCFIIAAMVSNQSAKSYKKRVSNK